MYIKESADITEFLNAVSGCVGGVQFRTNDGDSINLRSVLSRFLFTTIISEPNGRSKGRVICQNEQDYERLSEYLEKGE